MKWLIAVVLFFVGLALLDHHTLWGIAFILAGGGIIWLSLAGRRKNSAVHVYRPTEAPSAKVEMEAERRRAERDGKNLVNRARNDAEIEGRAAIRAAEARIASEPKWVA